MKKVPTVNDYQFQIWYSADDECFVAQVVGWPSIMADGASIEEAAYEIRDALDFALEVSLKHGNRIPEPKRVSTRTVRELDSPGGRKGKPASNAKSLAAA